MLCLDNKNSSGHVPSGGNLRNNQPVGDTGYRNDGAQAQSNQYSSHDDNDMQSHRGGFDKMDSNRISSYCSKSSERQYGDGRNYYDRGRRNDHAPSSYR